MPQRKERPTSKKNDQREFFNASEGGTTERSEEMRAAARKGKAEMRAAARKGSRAERSEANKIHLIIKSKIAQNQLKLNNSLATL